MTQLSVKLLLWFLCVFYVLLAFIIHLAWPEHFPVFVGLSAFAAFLLWLDRKPPKKLFSMFVIFLIIASIFFFVEGEFSTLLWSRNPTGPYYELGLSSLALFLLWYYIPSLIHYIKHVDTKIKEGEEIRSDPFIRFLLYGCWMFLAWFGYCSLFEFLYFIHIRHHFTWLDLISSWIFVALLIVCTFKIKKTEKNSQKTPLTFIKVFYILLFYFFLMAFMD